MELFHRNNNQHGSPEIKAQIFNRIAKVMHLSTSDTVLDVGSGDGYYSSKFAEVCGNVIAIDQYADSSKNDFYAKPSIEFIREDACAWIAHNQLGKVTQVFFSNSFHDMRCQDDILKSLSNKLANGAFLNIIEFKLDTLFGPPKSIRLSKEELKALVESYGFAEEAFIDLTTHYFISFKLVK
jgi:SAM-dependent methyltransferase